MSNENIQDNKTAARQRSNIYGLLAAVYRQEVTSDLLQQIKDPRFMGVFSDLGSEKIISFSRMVSGVLTKYVGNELWGTEDHNNLIDTVRP